jgi:uncharacterized protein (TIGR02391 family)
MELPEIVNQELWEAISANFNNGNYNGAIQDSIFYLSNILREKADSGNDGVFLINEAFSEKKPKIKLNKLESVSDKDKQQGMANILRGIYQAIRNPRMHDKINDSKEDAIRIILFIDYIISQVKNSKGRFDEEEIRFLIFDNEYSCDNSYAESIISQIPKNKRYDFFINILKEYPNNNINNLRHFCKCYFNILNETETEGILDYISKELRSVADDNERKRLVNMVPRGKWGNIERVAKIRTENKIIESIKKGKYLEEKYSDEGWLATWCSNVIIEAEQREKMDKVIFSKICSYDDKERGYVYKYILNNLWNTMEWPNDLEESKNTKEAHTKNRIANLMIENIINININLIEGIEKYKYYIPDPIRQYFINMIEVRKEDIDKEKERQIDEFTDDIPF